MSKSLKAINLPIISTSTCLHFALRTLVPHFEVGNQLHIEHTTSTHSTVTSQHCALQQDGDGGGNGNGDNDGEDDCNCDCDSDGDGKQETTTATTATTVMTSGNYFASY